MREYNDRVALALLRHHRDSVAAVESQIDDEEYEEACERIIDKLARLRERESPPGETPVETKSAKSRLDLIASGLRRSR